MQPRDTAQLLANIRAIYPFFDFPEQAIGLWNRALEDLAPEDCERALEAWIAESPKAPAPSDIRRLATAGNPPELRGRDNPPAGLPETVTVFRRLNPETGDYEPLPAPRTVTLEAFQKRTAELWREYRRLEAERNSVKAEAIAAAKLERAAIKAEAILEPLGEAIREGMREGLAQHGISTGAVQ